MPLTLKNFYKSWWTPWANTVAYYPLEKDTKDVISWNSLTASWTVTYEKKFGATRNSIVLSSVSLTWTQSTRPTWNNDRTLSIWLAKTSSTWSDPWIMSYGNNSVNNLYCTLTDGTAIGITNYWNNLGSLAWDIGTNTWKLITFVHSSWVTTAYINWVFLKTWSWTFNTTWSNIWVWVSPYSPTYYTSWNFSNFIVENVAWSAQEIADYYDLTKSLYWIS